jgi:hypothetical protein
MEVIVNSSPNLKAMFWIVFAIFISDTPAIAKETPPKPMSMAREPNDLEPFIPRFQADKPFLFLIRENKSGSILFLGRMLKP